MQKEIESVIFSNVGNRLTQELAIGLVMTVMQVAHQAVETARAEAAATLPHSGAEDQNDFSSDVSAAPPQNSQDVHALVDPAYARQDDQALAAPVRPRRASKPTTAKEARR